jgi:Tripartite tricarboxylate transporter TctB family
MSWRMKLEGLLFTLFIGIVMATALWFARDWPIRASIGVLVLGSIAVVLAIWQFALDARKSDLPVERSQFEMPLAERETKWGNVEIWCWIVGFYLLIVSIGFPIAVPLFVLAYSKFYGAGWALSTTLSVIAWGFVYGVFEKILHVPWPTPLIQSLL